MSAVPIPIQVLIVEDRAADAELMVRELRRAGFEPDWQRVDNGRDVKARLTPKLDLVLTDYNVPGYGAIPAIETLKAAALDIPLIVVSGSIGDDKAAECLKLGATDYILKDRMARLGPAVQRAIDEHRVRREKGQAEAALRRSEEQMRSILATVEDVVFSVAMPGYKVRYMNPAAEVLFGRPIPELLAGPNSWLDGIHPDDRARVAADQEKAARWGTNESQFRVVRPGGEVRHVNSRVWCSYAPDGSPQAFEGILTDITDKHMAGEQRKQMQHLRELNEFKSQFLNMVAHDLNNIVTPMRLNLHGIRAAVGRGELKEHATSVALINRGLDRLLGFLGDLLDAARLQSGKLAIQPRPMDLAAQVAAAVETVRGQAVEAGLTLAADLPPRLEVQADAHRIDQVVANLLSNALKFTPAGGTVRVSLAAVDGGARLTVADTGVGLDAADLPRLFQPFSKIGSAVQGKHTGTGLGLFISQGIVEGHGGRIWVESPGRGKGSSFSFWLPKEPLAGERPGPPAEVPPAHPP